ncbi:hypothetical protein BKA64DRAFT_750362 [Cadophora sp. MPI-SDFR-AT-0126]|nr:hypothetical protein BKA64DRAFT_750362 [Leotiomycetes sp. MPI-SDFR-AT-0126]
MAILKDGDDTYEVRIKRYPDGTYFDEHIKVEEREKPGAEECTRYIVGEAGMRYTIEVTLRKGFDFGKDDRVQAQLFFPGIKSSICYLDVFKPLGLAGLTTEDITKRLEFADVTIGGRKMLGTRLAFRSLAADENLKKSTDVVGIDPESLGYFNVSLFKLRWESKILSASEHVEKVAEAKRAHSQACLVAASATLNDTKMLWDTEKVDEDSFFKDGITCAVGFVGGKPEQSQSRWGHGRLSRSPSSVAEDVPLTQKVAYQGTRMKFYFRYRSADFVERTGIVPYPPPLYLYAWKDLTEAERKNALKELQTINKDHVHQALEAKSGGIVAKYGKGRKIDEPKEWRAWSMMYAWERELTFNTLKKTKRGYERGEVQRQFENNRGEIISLIDDEPKNDAQSKSKKHALTIVEEDDSGDELSKPTPKLKSKVNKVATGGPNVKNEPIDIDAPHAKKIKVEENLEPADVGSDDELKRNEELERQLAEEIEVVERLVKMKRERRALAEKIEAAKKKKGNKN